MADRGCLAWAGSHGRWVTTAVRTHPCLVAGAALVLLLYWVVWDYVYFNVLPLGNPPPDRGILAFLQKVNRTSGKSSSQPFLILAESNSRFHPMTRWWIDNLKKLKPPVTDYAIVALDQAERDRLLHLGQEVVHNEDINMDWEKTNFRTHWYNRIVRYKWQIVLDVLRSGRSLLLSDVDIYWRRNPLSYLQSLPKCDLYFGTDMRELPVNDNGTDFRLHPPFEGDGFTNWVNTGFMLLHPHPETIELAKKVLLRPLKGKDDQYIFNTHFEALYRRHRAMSLPGHDHHSCGRYGNLTFYFLRPDLFPHKLLFENYPFCRNYYTLHFNFLGDFTEKMSYMINNSFMHSSYWT